mmetsp:Transcript_14835/g.28271  ORF Transcript_14835/g.28271 Transcript_14835/m.28271 type:complete len:522 (-) Transcript_14835:118-1683(-)|eukprot:scaffold244_cov172-Amphora_coffeaeformis.AAC.37
MNATMTNDSVPDTIQEADEEQDEEVRIALEMAMAAAQNPGLTPAQLRAKVAAKNKQVDIVEQVKKQKEEKAKEEAAKKWQEQKEGMFAWVSASINDGKNKFRAAAESLQASADQHIYADKIRKDSEFIELKKRYKALRKILKTRRLEGNRVETRHRFKRHRMENNLLTQEERIEKARKLFCDTNYGLPEYGKAIIRAGRKYKNGGTKDEENLEAMLCRNMHQMLSIDKQKAKMKKSNKEVKKYLQRCQSWITDKQALWEMSLMKLDATHTSMQALYDDTLARQDKLIQKLKEAEDFKGIDLAEVDVSHFDEIPKNAGPRGMLCALRGLPFSDSIRVAKSTGGSIKDGDGHRHAHRHTHGATATGTTGGGKALYIETGDGHSVSSGLSDPDGDPEDFESSISAETGFGFGDDAPWNLGDSSLSPSKKSGAAAPETSKGQTSMKGGLAQPPSTITAPTPVVVQSPSKPTPSPPVKAPAETSKSGQPVSEKAAEVVKETLELSQEPVSAESVETTPCSTDSADE